MIYITQSQLPAGAVLSALAAALLAIIMTPPLGTPSSLRGDNEPLAVRNLRFFTGPTNGTVTFKAHCHLGVFDQAITATLTVSKAGKTSLVNHVPGAGEADGRKEFPRSTKTTGIATYYGNLLSNNGWVSGTDYLVSGSSIHLYGISQLDLGSNHKHLGVYGSVDSGTVTTVPVPKKLSVTRGTLLAAGTVYLAGFGFSQDPTTGQVTTATTPVACSFLEGDSAAQLVAKVANVLSENGWAYQLTGNNNEIVILRNGEDFPIQLLHCEVAYANKGLDENTDHWVLDWVQ